MVEQVTEVPSPSVLIVDDDEFSQDVLKEMLQALGVADIQTTGNGREALHFMAGQSLPPDFLICDIFMPEMDGPSLLRELRKTYPDMKFIFVSGYAEDAFARNLPADAKFGFLPKPFSLKQLAEAVREMLDE